MAPTNDVLAVVEHADGVRRLEMFQWGLVPSWAKDTKIGARMINARAETLHEKPSFRNLVRHQRLIVPMDGFYEWSTAATVASAKPVKTPLFIQSSDGAPLAAAGLWTTWRDPAQPTEAAWLHTCTIITVAANRTMAPVHDRMPALLPSSTWDQWLDPTEHDTSVLRQLLVPAADDVLVMHPVSTAVNSVRNNGSDLVAPV